jgi:hypothetical protein
MVDDEAAGALARPGGTGDDDDGRALGIGAGDGVDQIERARPEGDDGDAEAAVVARRGIRGKAHAGLVAQRVVRQDSALLDDLEKGQHEVARNSEDFTGAVILQALQQCGRERGHPHDFARSRHECKWQAADARPPACSCVLLRQEAALRRKATAGVRPCT